MLLKIFKYLTSFKAHDYSMADQSAYDDEIFIEYEGKRLLWWNYYIVIAKREDKTCSSKRRKAGAPLNLR